MFSVVNCVVQQHNLWLVLIAACVCAAGSWATIRLFVRGRLSAFAQALGWYFLTATAAGSSIWSTHFIAMLAYEPGAPVAFAPVLTVISLLVAVVGSFVSFVVAGSVRNHWAPAVGGGLLGVAVASMHYTGMLAYRVQGTIDWDLGFLIVSVLVSVLFSALSLHVACRETGKGTRPMAAGLLILAIISLHFTGMTAFKVTPIAIRGIYNNPADMQAMAVAVAMVGFIILGAVLASYLIDDKTRSDSLTRLREMAMSDALTAIANRAHFNDYLDVKLEKCRIENRKFALASIDLDRFKEINDTRGHSAGDEVLKVLAERMRSVPIADLFLARVGGDEFAAIFSIRDRQAAEAAASAIRAEIVKPIPFETIEIHPGASIGIAIFPDDAKDKIGLVNNADLALYRAKNDFSHKICSYDGSMDEVAKRRRTLAADLRSAIEANQLELYYQAQTSVSSGAVTGYEVLLRWKHPERGFIPPLEFIPLAEENGLILQLGEWVLRKACAESRNWDHQMKIAVNLSPVQFLHPNLSGLVREILEESGMPADRLELELTESAIISDKERTLATLNEIKALGVTIALDDFGTGYSSLDTLRAFPFDKIKLDRSFMHEVETSNQARAIIRAVLALGKSLEIPVLAEGIETANQLDILHEEGCDAAQGFYLGRPAPLSDLGFDTGPQPSSAELRNMLWELRKDGPALAVDGKALKAKRGTKGRNA
jgi:diguanylate cyclase (GGDEF)-like protein